MDRKKFAERRINPVSSREGVNLDFLEEGIVMDGTTIIRVVAGVLFVIVLVVLIQRRRTQVK